MSEPRSDKEKKNFEDDSVTELYVLHLYIAGATFNSIRAVRNTKAICEQYLKGRYELVVVDIYQQPELAQSDQIIATPTLVKRQPMPLRRLVGDMSDKNQVLLGLGLK